MMSHRTDGDGGGVDEGWGEGGVAGRSAFGHSSVRRLAISSIRGDNFSDRRGGGEEAGFADVAAAAAAAAQSRVYPSEGSPAAAATEDDLGGMDAFVAKIQSEAGSEVHYGPNGRLTVIPADEDASAEIDDSGWRRNSSNASNSDDAKFKVRGGADVRFVGGNRTSRFSRDRGRGGRGNAGGGGDGGNDGRAGKRSFGGGGVGPTSNSVAAKRRLSQSAGQARRADASPYGMDMESTSERSGRLSSGGGGTDGWDGEGAGAAERSVWRRTSPERKPTPRRSLRAESAAAVAAAPKGLVKPLPPRPARRSGASDSDAAPSAGNDLRRASAGATIRRGAADGGQPAGVAVRRRRVRVSVPPRSGGGVRSGSADASTAPPPPARRLRPRLAPPPSPAAGDASSSATSSASRSSGGGVGNVGDVAASSASTSTSASSSPRPPPSASSTSAASADRGGGGGGGSKGAFQRAAAVSSSSSSSSTSSSSSSSSTSSPLGVLRGMGPGSVSALAELGVHTVGELANMSDGDVDALKAAKPSLKLGHLRRTARSAVGEDGGGAGGGGGGGNG